MGNDAIFLLDGAGFIECNREAERLFGIGREDIIRKSPFDFSPETQPDGSNSKDLAIEMIRAAWSGRPMSFDWVHMKSDGTPFDATVSLDRVAVDGKTLLLAIVRDVTDQRKVEETTRETEQMFRAIVENSHAGIFTIDDSFRITYANDMTGRLLLLSNDEIIGRDFREFLDEESVRIVADRYVRRRMGEDVPSHYEFNVIRKDGTKRRVEISSTIYRTISGSLRTVGQVLDITEHKKADEELRRAHVELESRVEQRTRDLTEANASLHNAIARRALAEEALRQSELKYRHLVESANTIILEMDAAGRVTFLNDFAERFFGFSQSEMLGHGIVGTIVPAGREAERNFQALIDDIIKQPDRYTQNEYQFVKKNGEPVWIMWTNRPFFDDQGKLQRILRVGIDRTAQRRDQQAMEQQAREQAAATERNRLARDLHDAVSQTLFSASLIAEVLPNLWERDEAQGRKRLEEVRQLTRGALAEMRTLLLELRPSALVEADLGYLLKQLGESITGRSRVPVEVSIRGQCAPRPDVKVAIYRIAQESLNNIAKHANATTAAVSLVCESDSVTLRVTDNGRGFDAGAGHQDSLGLGIMRERARQIGASLTIRSKPGKGTTVRLTWKGSAEAEI